MEELPTKYDVIVVGTGMTPSIIAGAFSRVGKSVLHLDENDYYGEEWASFNLDGIESWTSAKPPTTVDTDFSQYLTDSEHFIAVNRKSRCWNIQQKWSCENEPDNNDENWTKEKLLSNGRKFNLDLSPRMPYSRGPLVELLISSNIARYAEFKTVTRVLTFRENQLEVVPCSRADVFATRHVSVVQKRVLVKVLKLFSEYPECGSEFEGFEQKTFIEYLRHKKLDDQLIHYILYAIAMGSDGMMCLDGVKACQRFLHSLGRYGNTPFICPLYGAGEIPQCFCRLCAVFGGVYHLKRSVDGFVINEKNQVTAVVSGGQKIEASQFIVTSSLSPETLFVPEPSKPITRGIFVTDKSIHESEKEAVTLLQFPPTLLQPNPVTVMELGGACHVCPPGLFVIHMTTQDESFSHVEDALFGGDHQPRILWSLTWKMDTGRGASSDSCPNNLKFVPGADAGIDYDDAVETARLVFSQLCTDEEFLPRAPDPEEIVMEDAEPQESSGGDAGEETKEGDAGEEMKKGDTEEETKDEGNASDE